MIANLIRPIESTREAMLERGRELSNQKGSLDPLLLCDVLCVWDVREGESIFFDWINLIRNPDGQIPYWRNMCCKEGMNNSADCNSVPWFMAGGHFQFRLQNPPIAKKLYQNYSYFLEVEIVPSLTVWPFPSEVKMKFEWNQILPFEHVAHFSSCSMIWNIRWIFEWYHILSSFSNVAYTFPPVPIFLIFQEIRTKLCFSILFTCRTLFTSCSNICHFPHLAQASKSFKKRFRIFLKTILHYFTPRRDFS